jgi:predicted transposase/invertase (TIGR01784 family)
VKYFNPYTDFGFKKLFGEEANKDLLMDFLNQLLPPQHQIVSLTLNNGEQLPPIKKRRRAVFDIYCISSSGEHFVVVMQKAMVNFFKDRSLFYATFPIQRQSQVGKWDYRLDSVYLIAILDFEYDEQEERRKFLREVQLKDQDGDLFYDKLHFKFVQMPLFDKQADELETHFDKWIYFLKHLNDLDEIPAILREPIFEKAFHTAEVGKLSADELMDYQMSQIDYWDMTAAIDSAEKNGLEKGLQIGREEGRNATQMEIVLRMAEKGMAAPAIADLLGLPIDLIQAILAARPGH